MPRVRFQPLRISKRSWRAPWVTSNAYRDHTQNEDPEKTLYDDNDDYETDQTTSQGSSRASSGSYGSHEAMLEKKPTFPASSSAYSSQVRSRQTCNRYFTIILGSILVLLVLALTRLHFDSARDIELGLHKLTPKPALWEDFPVLHRYFGGLRSIIPAESNVPEYPGSKSETAEKVIEALQSAAEKSARNSDGLGADVTKAMPLWSPLSPSDVSACFLDEKSRVKVPEPSGLPGTVKGFPDHVIGMSMDNVTRHAQCTDRFGKLGAYGLGYSTKNGGTGGGLEGDRSGLDQMWVSQGQIDYLNVDWTKAQDACKLEASANKALPKTAILVRTSSDHQYDPEELLSLRSLIAETALAQSGSFSVHFLVEVPEDSAGIWSDESVYQQFLASSLPAEFAGQGTLWSVDQMHLIYGDVAHAHREGPMGHSNDLLPVQHFAHSHPEYEQIWNWDMSVRSTGHIGQVLTAASDWAREQPRKELWNRNDRFYVPSEHGTWDDFRHMVRVQSEHGAAQKTSIWSKAALRPENGEASSLASVQKPVWGALSPLDDEMETSVDGKPPTTQDKDHYNWGVGEEADLVSLSPIFDPDGTLFGPADSIAGYNVTRGFPPRRATLSGLLRISRRLLETMHGETLKGRGMHASLWPASVALHHGLKAVHAPQATYVDRMWPTDYLAAVLNSGLNGAAGGARTSVFDDGRVHNLRGLSWSAGGEFATRLWKRWLGYRVDGQGGEEWELQEGSEGRMCLPPMLLWPVKGIELVVQ